MASIQCKGKEMVLEMFQNRDVQAWSIFQGKQYQFKGLGDEELEATIDMLVRSGSNSMYTLRVYEDITSAKEIKEKTQSDGSFNFVLNCNNPFAGEDNQSAKTTISAITKRIEDKIATKLGIIMDAEEEPPEPETIGEILQSPDKMKEYIEIIGMIRNIFSPQQQVQPAYVGNVTKITDAPAKEYTESDQIRLMNAINKLEANDPDILIHLEKLAKISDNKPLFQNLITMLNAMQ